MVQYYSTMIMFTYKKWYMGFCTLRRTIMDPKKIKIKNKNQPPITGYVSV
jgi:hypothetical protein